MNLVFVIFHIIFAIALIGLIMLQQEGTGLSATFGGSSTHYHSRRGMEKIIFYLTIFLAAIFLITSLVSFLTY